MFIVCILVVVETESGLSDLAVDSTPIGYHKLSM